MQSTPCCTCLHAMQDVVVLTGAGNEEAAFTCVRLPHQRGAAAERAILEVLHAAPVQAPRGVAAAAGGDARRHAAPRRQRHVGVDPAQQQQAYCLLNVSL